MSWHLQRLKEELTREIGVAIAEEMRDPRIPEVITITEVRLASDCRNATVFVSMMGEMEEKKSVIKVLNHAAPFIQHYVATKIVMKFVPRLYFKLDNSLEESERINKLLEEIKDDLV
jgi:ribosome-binding factor A